MKKVLLFVCAAIIAFSFTSCDKDDEISSVYTYGIEEWSSSNLTDMVLVEAYFTGKQLTNGAHFTIVGKSEAENDKEAIAKFNNLIKNVVATELDEILDINTTFCFNLVKGPSDPDVSNYLVEYCYPAK